MVPAEIHAVTARLDMLRDILIELAAALPPDLAANVVAAIGNRLTGRLGDTELMSPPMSRWSLTLRRCSRPCTTHVFSSDRPDCVFAAAGSPARQLVGAWSVVKTAL